MMGNCSAHHDEENVHLEQHRHFLNEANESYFQGAGDGCQVFHLIVNCYLMGVLCIVGMIGNTVSMVILRLDRQNRAASFLLQTLACVDNLLLVLSFITLTIVSKSRISESKLVIINSLGYVSQAASIWVTVLLGINRYYAVCKPFQVGQVTLRSVKFQISIVLLLCVVFNLPRFIPASTTFNQSTDTNGSNLLANISMSKLVRREIVNSHKMAYESLYTILVLILPLVLLFCLNFKLARCLSKLKRRLMNFRKEYRGSNEANITVVMVVVVIVMVVCHTPDRVLQTLKLLQFYRDTALTMPQGVIGFPCCPNVFSTTQYLTNLFIVFSSSVNFLIYFVLRKRFRRILKYKVTKFFFKSKRPTRSFNTTTIRPYTGYRRSIAL